MGVQMYVQRRKKDGVFFPCPVNETDETAGEVPYLLVEYLLNAFHSALGNVVRKYLGYQFALLALVRIISDSCRERRTTVDSILFEESGFFSLLFFFLSNLDRVCITLPTLLGFGLRWLYRSFVAVWFFDTELLVVELNNCIPLCNKYCLSAKCSSKAPKIV